MEVPMAAMKQPAPGCTNLLTMVEIEKKDRFVLYITTAPVNEKPRFGPTMDTFDNTAPRGTPRAFIELNQPPNTYQSIDCTHCPLLLQ